MKDHLLYQGNKNILIIQLKDHSYADTLKLVKQAVNPRQLGIDIRDIRKT